MTFVNLSLLAGTALVALPIVLHLIMRRKPKLFEFPALRFVRSRHDTNQRRLRLRHLLLLLLRAAVIGLLAFAMARPSLQWGSHWGSQESPVSAAFVFDAAPRMGYRQDNQTRLEVAQKFGLMVLAQLPPESEVAVLDTHTGAAAFQADRGSAQQRIQRLSVVPNSEPLTSSIEQAAELLAKGQWPRREIYIFTDLAQGGWPLEASARLQQRLGELGAVGLHVVDVGSPRPTNDALGEVRLSSQVASSRSTLTVGSSLTRIAPSEAGPVRRAVELYRFDENRQPQLESVENVEIVPGQSRQVEFRLGGLTEGTHQGFLRVVGQDGLAADDTRYFTVEVRPPWRVLLVAPHPAADSTRYLAAALAPPVSQKRGQARYHCDVLDQHALGDAKLDDYSAVFLLDPKPLGPDVWRKLADYVAEGHGLGVFLGRNAGRVDEFNTPQALEVLPGRLKLQARRPDGGAHLAPRDYQHPVLSAFRNVATAIPWQAFPIFRFWQFEDVAPGVSVILGLNDQSPLLFERSLGAGRVLTLATPISDRADAKAWNVLPVGVIDNSAPFVMLANQMADYLVGASEEQLNYLCGQTASLLLDSKNQRRNFVLVAPGDLSLPISADSRQARLTITATDAPGNYRVVAGGTRDGVDRGFSMNLAPSQTELARLSPDELRQVFGPLPYQLARTEQEIERDVSVARVGRELFTPLILLVALLLAAEQWVANRFYRE